MRLPIPGAILKAVFSACGLIAAPLHASPEPVVRYIKVEGNLRVPAATILHHIKLSPGNPFDSLTAQKSLEKLQSLGIFEYIEVDTREAGENRIDAIFRVKELPFVSAFVLEGLSGNLEEQVREYLRKEKLEIIPSRPYGPALAHKAARAVRLFLQARKYPQASVELLEERRGSQARVVLRVHRGPRLQVDDAIFDGNTSLTKDELHKQMRHVRAPSLWNRWSQAGAYVPEDLAADLESIRRYYRSRGYAAVKIGPPDVKVRTFSAKRWLPLPIGSKEEEKLIVRIPIEEGPRFRLASIRAEGDAKGVTSKILALLGTIQAPCQYDSALLENIRQKIVAALGRHGYALARVRLDERTVEGLDEIHAVYTIDAGEPVEVGVIRFEGNLHLPEKFLRRELVTKEAEIFDSFKLDESIDRLNRSNLIRELRRTDVALDLDEDRNALDITFKLKEKDRQGFYATGGTGGIAGGYLGVIYTAFNLLGLGEVLTLELDGGAAQSNILVDLVGSRFLGSPFALALSGFHRYTNLNIASLVPGPDSLLSVFRRRSAGFGLSGGYTVRRTSQLGLGYQVEREYSSGSAEGGVTPTETAAIIRGELMPSFVFDSTNSTGTRARGTRLTVSHALTGSALLGVVKADRPSFSFGQYMDDPWTSGRNAFAFRLHGGAVRARGQNSLPLDQRFFPGNEVVRGFRRGSLSPWIQVPENGLESLRPAGADTVLGFSAEYRVPLRGALSGAAFVDLGWSRMELGSSEQTDKSARLVEETNRLLRASVGGELRLQLPVIRQPARLIFAWNPLRLDRVLEGASSPVRLTDPRSAIRFALGQ